MSIFRESVCVLSFSGSMDRSVLLENRIPMKSNNAKMKPSRIFHSLGDIAFVTGNPADLAS